MLTILCYINCFSLIVFCSIVCLYTSKRIIIKLIKINVDRKRENYKSFSLHKNKAMHAANPYGEVLAMQCCHGFAAQHSTTS